MTRFLGTRTRPGPCLPGLAAYSLAISIATERDVNPPEICDAIRKAATTAGTLINLRNWSTESIVFAPKNAVAKKPVQFAVCAVCRSLVRT